MKTIRIDFVDFFGDFNKKDNFITRALRKRYNVEISDNPDYIFYSCFGFEHVNYDCVKIFFTGEDVSPDFNLCDYAIGFDRITFKDRYLRFPIFAIHTNGVNLALEKHHFTKEDIEKKTGFCNFVFSNGNADPCREDFFNKLSEYKRVDSGGRYLNNIGGPVEDKLEFQKNYKFSIAFENDSSLDYTTEKILDALAARTIPIYWGNPDVSLDFNPKCFINCNDFDSFDDVIERVKEIDNDPELFCSILAEPTFVGEKLPEEFSKNTLEEFLFNIFDQPLETVSRRSKYNRDRFYISYMKKMIGFYNDYSIIWRIKNRLRSIK